MPHMDGYEVMKRLRATAAYVHIPIVVSTSLEDDETREKAIAYGANGFVTKPYNRTLLLHAVQNAVRLSDMAAVAEQTKAQQQQKKLLDNLPSGAALYEYDGEKLRAVHINKSYWDLVGREPGDYINRSIFDAIHPDDHEAIRRELDSAVRQRRNMEVDLRVLGGDGSYKPFHATATVTPEPGGKYEFFAVFTPISDDTLAIQQMLPVALSTMMSSSDDLSYVMDRDCHYVCCSKSVAALLNLKSERDIFGKTDMELFGQERGAAFTVNNRAVAESGKPMVNCIEEIPRADGGMLYVSTSIYPILNPAGHVIGLYGISHDLTKERQLHFELDALLNTIPSGVLKYAADEGEQFAYINRNFVESLGYTKASFREKFNNSFREMLWHEDREWAESEVIRQEGNGGIGKFDYRVEAANGELRWIHDEGIKITDQEGKSWYYVTLVDITDSHEAYEQLKLLTDSTPTGLATYVCNKDGIRITYCNNDFCKLLGTAHERLDQITAVDPVNYVYEEDREKILAQFDALTRDNTALDCVYRIRTVDGSLRWVHQRAVVSERRGKTVYVNSALFDITAQQEALEKLRVSEEVNRLALEHSGKIIARFDVKNRTLTMPESMNAIFEVPHVLENMPEEQIALGRISPETADAYRRIFREVTHGSPAGEATYQQHSTLGWRWIEARYTTVFSSMHEPVSAIVTFDDVTEQLEKEMVYHKWQQSLTNRPVDSYTLFRCNLSKNAFFDSCEGSLIDLSFADNKQDFGELAGGYAGRVYQEDREKYLAFVNSDAMLAGYYRGRRADALEYREVQADGTLRWLQLSVELVEYPNSRDVEVYLMYEDINDAKLKELQTREQAETDPLTGVLNRTTFAARMDEILSAARVGEQHALMLVDIDDFKRVNDTYGHDAGDRVLRDLTTLIRTTLRRDDLVGRLGGDEFFVFLRNMPGKEVAAAKAGQICGLKVHLPGTDTPITVSVGVAMSPGDGRCFEELYKKSDTALYRQKAAGKNGFQFPDEASERRKTVK